MSVTQADVAARYEDRLRRYCGLAKAPSAIIELGCDVGLVEMYTTQIGLLTAASLLGRLFGQVRLLIPPTAAVHPKIFGEERTLEAALLRELELARPRELRESPLDGDSGRLLRVNYGMSPCDVRFFGNGWTASVGDTENVLPELHDENPFGAALAAILAAAEAFLLASDATYVLQAGAINLWSWTSASSAGPALQTGLNLGEIWVVGVGSVGSAAIHFLCLSQLAFSASLFDGDKMQIENISRSPVFSSADTEGEPKADIVERYLRARGVAVRHSCPTWLHLSGKWETRFPGEPDLVISTANEHHVRWHIENAFPPMQLHASTGKNWQAAVFRHVPIVDPCSLCVFPDSGIAAQPVCATGSIVNPGTEDTVDASLPFLSYAAGLMIAVEAYKIVVGQTQPSRRTYLQFGGGQRTFSVPLVAANTCFCRTRDLDTHRKVIRGSRHAFLSETSDPT